jgi:hypothetical protein
MEVSSLTTCSTNKVPDVTVLLIVVADGIGVVVVGVAGVVVGAKVVEGTDDVTLLSVEGVEVATEELVKVVLEGKVVVELFGQGVVNVAGLFDDDVSSGFGTTGVNIGVDWVIMVQLEGG